MAIPVTCWTRLLSTRLTTAWASSFFAPATSLPDLGNANPAAPAAPAAQNLGKYPGTGEIIPFLTRAFEWGVVIAKILSVVSIVPCHCARLTYFLHPKLRKTNAVLIPLKLIALAVRRLRRAERPSHKSKSNCRRAYKAHAYV